MSIQARNICQQCCLPLQPGLWPRWNVNWGRGRAVSSRSRPNRGRPVGSPATNKFSLLHLYFFFFFGWRQSS